MREVRTYLLDCMRHGRAVSEVPVHDVHGHLGEYRVFPICGGSADAVVGQMDRLGVRTLCASHLTVVFHGGPYADEPVLDGMRRYPDRILGYCCPDPRIRECGAAYVERRLREGFRGIKLHDFNGLPYTAESYREIYELAQDRGIPVLFHAWSSFKRFCSPVMNLFPRLVCIIAHMGGGCDFLSDTIKEDAAFIGRYPNVHVDFSAAVVVPGYVENLAKRIGSERLLLGTDMPFVSGTFNLGCAASLDLDDDSLLAILGGNARRLFGIAECFRQLTD